jgi:hypothetical protein
VIEDLSAALNLKQFVEGSLQSDRVLVADVFEAINLGGSRLSLARRITSDALVHFPSLARLAAHPRLLEALKRVKGYRTQDVGGWKPS